MRSVSLSLSTVVAVALSVTAAMADFWDTSGAGTGTNDDTPGTHNELVHGSDQLHDLAVRPGSLADQDWFRIRSQPRSSYEVIVDSTAGDIEQPFLQLWNDAGTTLLASGSGVGSGFTVSLRWQNTTASPVDHRIKVISGNGGCTTDCGSDDVYRIRTYETTYAVSRFNNTGTQVTVLLLQNASPYSIADTHVYLWGPSGSLIADYQPGTLGIKSLLNWNTAAVAPGLAGSITVSHLARYGDLSGKGTSLETATGFSFDTLLTPRPH